jgi:hypothetical protein
MGIALGACWNDGATRRRMTRTDHRVASLVLLLLGTATAAGAPRVVLGDPLLEKRADGTVDWRSGVLTTEAGAAADLRMPSAAIARAGSERRARAAALTRLVALLESLPTGPGRSLEPAAIERAVSRATIDGIDYQSNGGIVLRMQCNFGDWAVAPPATKPEPQAVRVRVPVPELSISLPEARLQAIPALVVAGKPLEIRAARYRPAASLAAGTHPISAHVDRAGRIVLDGRLPADEIGTAAVVIYFQRLTR